MRTTLTLEDEIAEALKELAHRTGRSFKAVTNEVLRNGLAVENAPPKAKRYRLQPRSLGGARPGIDLDRALELSDALEVEALATKLELRK